MFPCKKAFIAAAAGVTLAAGTQTTPAQTVSFSVSSRAGYGGCCSNGSCYRPSSYDGGFYAQSSGEYYRAPVYYERRSGRRETICYTDRTRDYPVRRCESRQYERYERYDGRTYERHERRRSVAYHRDRRRSGISLGIWFDGKGRSIGEDGRRYYDRRRSDGEHARGQVIRHTSRGRSHYVSHHSRSSQHRSEHRVIQRRRVRSGRHR
jgi:hypothetical protein